MAEGMEPKYTKNFEEVIAFLEKKSKICKRNIVVLGGLVTIVVLFSVLSLTLFSGSRGLAYWEDYDPLSKENVARPFVKDIVRLMERLNGPIGLKRSGEIDTPLANLIEQKIVRENIAIALVNLDSAVSISNKGVAESNYAELLTRLIYSVGVVGFLILFIQMIIMFMRYYARLAEAYDSHMVALRITNGDPNKAIELSAIFSPNHIDLGKTPSSLHEKVLESATHIISGAKKS